MARLNKKLTFLFFVLSFTFSSQVFASNVETISISVGDVISKEISINPGFAVMFQFSDEVVALTLADQTAFACDKMPTDISKVLCKPLTQNPYATNLVVTTESNEFNLVLSVDPSGKKHAFKYVFSNGKVKGTNSSNLKSNIQLSRNYGATSGNLMELILDHYVSGACRLKGENTVLKFRCLDFVEIGSERYVRFVLSGNSSSTIRILKLVLAEESLGGLTGLSVKESSSRDIEYSLKDENLSRGEESYGIIKLPHDTLKSDKRTSLMVMTDLGQQHDLKIYGL